MTTLFQGETDENNLLALSLALAFSSAPGILHAEGNINAGKEKAAACASCHGDDGNSMVSTFPKLASSILPTW